MPKHLSPTVAGIVEAIRNEIRDGSYVPGSFLPAEQEIAAKFGVSRGTVRLAIGVLVDSGDITRRQHSRPIIGIQKETTIPAEGNDVHVWVSHPIADEATLQFMKGISAGLVGTGLRMIVREPTRFFGDHVKSDERQFLTDLIGNDRAAGVIVQRDPYADNADVIAKLIDSGKPVVFADIPAPEGLAADHVGTANLAAARLCVEHLIKLGHHNIICVADHVMPEPTRERIRGYRRAMKQAGLEDLAQSFVANELPEVDTAPWNLGGRFVNRLTKNSLYSGWAHRLADHILSLSPRPTAIFVTCDVLAFWLCSFLEGAGVSVPDEMSIVGFDWLSRWDGPENDSLTTASQDFLGMGRYASDLLLDRLTGYRGAMPRHILLEAPLVVRSSTATELSVSSSGAPPNSSSSSP